MTSSPFPLFQAAAIDPKTGRFSPQWQQWLLELFQQVHAGGGGGSYTLPTATASRLGGVKKGSGLAVAADGTLSTDLDAVYSKLAHTHNYSNLEDIPTVFNPSSHSHEISDVNELQSAIDAISDSYSTTESLTNKKWIDGKSVYRKVVYLGYLTDATQFTVASGLSGVTMVSITGIARDDGSTIAFTIPFFHPDPSAGVGIWMDTNYNIACKPAGNRTTYKGWAILEYVKN